MGTQEDIRRMKNEGKSENEIIDALRKQKVSDKEISDALVQLKIKEAVTASSPELNEAPSPSEVDEGGYQFGEEKSSGRSSIQTLGFSQQTKQPSKISQGASVSEDIEHAEETVLGTTDSALSGGREMTGQEFYGAQQESYTQAPQQEEYVGAYPAQQSNYPEGYSTEVYQQYQPYQEVISSEMITEISEQVVSEKLSTLQDKLERATNFRTVAEARISSLNERLKRIEKIIDRLQLSLLQKVGEYVTDVKDLKQELEETQKSFKTLASRKHGHQHAIHHQTHSHEHAHEHEKKHHP